ncbi:MAG: helix-turn-helix transcriptional regulator [Patescibacteria group bacterium]|nr:helix-turn-helix transcriptional regulator [Patescibacteria group bacterium]
MGSSFAKLRQLRKINEITLSEVSSETGLSIGYLNRIERGYISDIKNLRKKERLIQYIDHLKQTTRQNHTLDENLITSLNDKDN